MEMIRHMMIREFLAHPAELLTFRKWSRLVASDADILHVPSRATTLPFHDHFQRINGLFHASSSSMPSSGFASPLVSPLPVSIRA
jgi:hypothetical protein